VGRSAPGGVCFRRSGYTRRIVGELIIAPARFGARTLLLAVRAIDAVTSRSLGLAESVLRTVAGADEIAPVEQSAVAADADMAAAVADIETVGPTTPDVDATTPDADAATPDIDATTQPPPAHVSSEPELVEEIADPGAEEGAGAEVTVAEPWPGYGKMTAPDVIDRLAAAGSAELAAVALYEDHHRRRATVLAAVRRQLAHSTG
jgi:hypothetical protein